ncbi:MAG: hypothetical protein H7A53_04020 [Akkermansiaceae bacterium]|nr:hypothetical protein [Akkermansiaceae bacterium]MCP5550040.1 hypothetical protein [Akkermansiaceae bacterium]
MKEIATIQCPKCRARVEAAPSATARETRCVVCQAPLSVRAFPRLAAKDAKDAAFGTLSAEGDAVCTFYPELQAETVCDECGCFLSEKAAVHWNDATLCMPCLHQLREKRDSDAYLSKRTLHDNVALGLTVLLAPFTLLTGPMALYHLIRHRKASRGIVPRGPFRWWLALVLALAATGGWLFLIVLWISMIVREIAA